MMSNPSQGWDAAVVRKWLALRLKASKADQAAADRRGYEAQDEYDKAAAEEWVCHALQVPDSTNEQAIFAQRLKDLIAREEYQATGIYDDVRFERHVRSHLRKVAKMAKANEGFGKTLHYQ
jgi:hypothetical protein